MKLRKIMLAGMFGAATLMSSAAMAATDIQWWHAHGGRLGEVVNEIADKYNASQSVYNLVPTYKGGYEDTMTAGIAAFSMMSFTVLISSSALFFGTSKTSSS